MRYIIIFFLLFLFFKGFFTNSSINYKLLLYFSDKELHFLAFLIVPFIISILLKRWYLVLLSWLFFFSMSYGVEVLQQMYFNRIYSLLDFKYSLFGVFCSLLFYLSWNMFSKYPKVLFDVVKRLYKY